MDGLSKDASKRATSAAELAAALRDAYLAAGLVDSDEVARPASRRIPLPTDTPNGGSRAGAVLLMVLAFSVLVGVGLIYAVESDDEPVVLATDAGVADGGLDAGGAALTEPVSDGGVDLGPEEPLNPDMGEPDGGAMPMTPHEREEAAKDALDRARRLLRDGDVDGAREALAEASRYDPGNPDIQELQSAIDEGPGPG